MRRIFRRVANARGAGAVGVAVFASLAGWAACARLTPLLNAADGSPPGGVRAVGAFVALLVGLSILWLWICRRVERPELSLGSLVLLATLALGARGLLFFSPPALEIDYLRYFWDGEVGVLGIDPYRYTPAEAIEADRGAGDPNDAGLAAITTKLDAEPNLRELLYRVHYPEIPTAYPPVSQWVLTGVAKWDRPFDLERRLAIWKLVLLAAEAATLALCAWWLRAAGRSWRLFLIPALCPLAIKEVANSGRLDPLAVLLTTAAFCAVVALRTRPQFAAASAGVLLGLAFAAKYYPLILAPIFVGWCWGSGRTRGESLQAVAVGTAGFLVSVTVAFVPFISVDDWTTPFRGARTFAESWQMNDLLFGVMHTLFKSWKIGPEASAARTFVAVVAVAVAIYNGVRVARHPHPATLGTAALATLGWFWLWSPTGNPWYLLWLLPLLPFAENRAWRWLPVAALLYYARFACELHSLAALQRFDEVGVWIEFGPWIVYWAWEQFRPKRADPG